MFANTFRASTVACVMLFFASPAVADRISITVTNNTGFVIKNLYIGGASRAQMEDRLGGRVLELGQRREFGIESDSTCAYDFEAVLAGDSSGVRYSSMTGCESRSITLD